MNHGEMLMSPAGAAAQGFPAIGPTGQPFATLQAAIDGVDDEVVAGVVPQAGTVAGILVLTPGAPLSAVDDFYVGWYVRNSDATPSNGMVERVARVSAYVAATATFTLDGPWDYAAEATVDLLLPAQVSLLRSVTENLTVTKNVEILGEGHEVQGSVDQTAGALFLASGLRIRDGFQKTNAGYGRFTDGCSIGRRGTTIYALLFTEGSDLGRLDIYDTETEGRVASRRGRMGYSQHGCRPRGTDEVPVAIVEAPTGVTVTLTQLDYDLEGEFGGAVLFADNGGTITGAPTICSGQSDISMLTEDFFNAPAVSVRRRRIAFWRAHGSATITLTLAAGTNVRGSVRVFGLNAIAAIANMDNSAVLDGLTYGAIQGFTGTVTVTLTSPGGIRWAVSGADAAVNGITAEGADCTGTVNCSGTGSITVSQHPYPSSTNTFFAANFLARVSGNVTLSNSMFLAGLPVGLLFFRATQDAGVHTVTIGTVFMDYCPQFFWVVTDSTITVSAGTYTWSGCNIRNGGFWLGRVPAQCVAGSTFNVTGNVRCFNDQTQNNGAYRLWRMEGTATSTVSGLNEFSQPEANGFAVGSNSAAGGSLTVSGVTAVRNCRITGAAVVVEATNAAGTCIVSNTVTFFACTLEGAFTIVTATGTVTGPSSTTFNACHFNSTLTTQTGAGALTWAAATLRLRNCHVEGLLTFVGDAFATVEAFETFFNGNAAGDSILATGTRPTTYRLWKCGTVGNVERLLPEVIDDWTVQISDGAITAGQICTISATGATPAVAGTTYLGGVALTANGGAAEAAILVRRGKVFVDADGTVAAGNVCVNDAAGTPTDMIAGAPVVGRTVGVAREAAGATRVGEAYTVVDLR